MSAAVERSMVLLNGLGDIEIRWSPDADERMRLLIETKMKAGIRFFIVKHTPILGERKVRLKQINKLGNDRAVYIDDDKLSSLGVVPSQVQVHEPELAELASNGLVRFARREQGQVEALDIAKTVAAVLTNHTVAIRALTGG